MATSPNQSRYARASLVLKDLFPKMLRQLVTGQSNPVPAPVVHGMISRDREIQQKLNAEETEMFQSLQTDGYDNLDFSFLYKLIKYYKLLDEPTQDWGSTPSPTELTIGDDVERLRKYRNSFIHRTKSEVTEEEEHTFFTDLYDIARRVDVFLGQNNQYFENEVTRLKTCNMDEQTKWKYIDMLERYLELKEQCSKPVGRHNIKIYYGKDIIEMLEVRQGDEGSTEKITAYMSCSVNKEEIVRRINELKDELNKEDYIFVVDKAETGSIIIHITLKSLAFSSRHTLENSVLFLYERLFSSEELDLMMEDSLSVTIAISDNNFPCENDDDMDDLSSSFDFDSNLTTSGWIKLHVAVDRELMSDEQRLQSSVTNFVGGVIERVENAIISPNRQLFASTIDVVLRHSENTDSLDRNIS